MVLSRQLPETVGDEGAEGGKRGLCVGPRCAKRELLALATTEEKNAHDALRVRNVLPLADFDPRLEAVGHVDQLRGGASV